MKKESWLLVCWALGILSIVLLPKMLKLPVPDWKFFLLAMPLIVAGFIFGRFFNR